MALYPLLRPFAFALDAERAHRWTIEALKRLPAARPAPPDPALSVNVAGLSFPNPVGLAAGFDGNAWLDHWASDPWTHGSYAAFEPGQFTRYWGFVGRHEGRLLFGGEHTALAAQGFLDGAVASGERCALEVARLA